MFWHLNYKINSFLLNKHQSEESVGAEDVKETQDVISTLKKNKFSCHVTLLMNTQGQEMGKTTLKRESKSQKHRC